MLLMLAPPAGRVLSQSTPGTPPRTITLSETLSTTPQSISSSKIAISPLKSPSKVRGCFLRLGQSSSLWYVEINFHTPKRGILYPSALLVSRSCCQNRTPSIDAIWRSGIPQSVVTVTVAFNPKFTGGLNWNGVRQEELRSKCDFSFLAPFLSWDSETKAFSHCREL